MSKAICRGLFEAYIHHEEERHLRRTPFDFCKHPVAISGEQTGLSLLVDVFLARGFQSIVCLASFSTPITMH